MATEEDMRKVILSAIAFILVTACMVIISGCGGDVTIDPEQSAAGGTSSSTPSPIAPVPPIAPSPPVSSQLVWDAPTTNPDGTPLNGTLAGYKVYYGTASGNYTMVIDAGNVTSYDVSGLAAGTYYFVVTAYDTVGSESPYSNEVMRTN
jgi:hypothetical protein